MDPEKMAFITITELFPVMAIGPVADGVTVATACSRVGRSIEQEYRAEIVSHADKKSFQRKMQYAAPETGGQQGALNQMWKKELEKMRKESRASPPEWTAAMKVKLAARLFASLIDVAKIQRTAKVLNKQTGQMEEK
jgi:DNA-directed RNA polymerase